MLQNVRDVRCAKTWTLTLQM